MTIQELLSQVDYLEVAKEHLKKYTFLTRDGYVEDVAKCKVVLQKFAEMLSSLTPEPSNDILLAVPYLEEGEWSIEAELYVKDEVLKNFKPCSIPEEVDIHTISREESQKILTEIYEHIPQRYGYEFCRWEEVLGAEVFQENFNQYGAAAFVSAALFEMSFNGMTREHQEERRAELDKSMQECDELLKLPEEERNQHYISSEEFEKKLEEDFGYKDTRTPEEKAEELRMTAAEGVLSRIAEYKALSEVISLVRETIR